MPIQPQQKAAQEKLAKAKQDAADTAQKALEAKVALIAAVSDHEAASKTLEQAEGEAFKAAQFPPAGAAKRPKRVLTTPTPSPKQDALWLKAWLKKNGVDPKNVCPTCSAEILGLLKKGYGGINWKEQGRKILCKACRPKNGWIK